MTLRRLQEKDANGMLEWMHDPEIQKSFQAPMGEKTLEDVRNFIQSASIAWEDGKSVHYAIADETDEYMGTISLKELDMHVGKAEYAISLRKNAQGKGIATQATMELLRLAFEEHGLKRVYLNVLADNERAIQLYEKCGFRYEGEFRKHLLLRNEYRNLKWYAVLEEEYAKICQMVDRQPERRK